MAEERQDGMQSATRNPGIQLGPAEQLGFISQTFE